MSAEIKSSELTLDEAIKWAQEWQQSSEIAILAEIVTGLVDGAIELRRALEDVRVLLLPDSCKDMRPSMASITKAKQRIRTAYEAAGVNPGSPALVDGSTPKDEGERCPDCGSTEAGSCFYCKQD